MSITNLSSDINETEEKICEGTSGDPGSNLRCLYEELNKSQNQNPKDTIKIQKILKDILSVLTYPQFNSKSKKYKLTEDGNNVRIENKYRLIEQIDKNTQNKTYKIRVEGQEITLTKKSDKIFVSDSNTEYTLTDDGNITIYNTYKLIKTIDKNGITTYKIILNDDENNSEITLDKISTDTFVRNPNPTPFTCEKNVKPITWRIPDGQFNSLINQLKNITDNKKFNLDQNNAIKKYILERSQCKYNNELKTKISSGYKNFNYWRNNGGKKTRKCQVRRNNTRKGENKTRKTRRARKSRKSRKSRKGHQ